MEAMKMEHRLLAEIAGKVVSLHVAVGQQVAAGAVLLEIADE
jgi:biotin carboxyl carrier protein